MPTRSFHPGGANRGARRWQRPFYRATTSVWSCGGRWEPATAEKLSESIEYIKISHTTERAMKPLKNPKFAVRWRCLSVLLVSAFVCSGCDSTAPNASPKSDGGFGRKTRSRGKRRTLPSKKAKKVGVLIVSHGSRSKSWSKMLLDIEKAVRNDLRKSGRVDGIRSGGASWNTSIRQSPTSSRRSTRKDTPT